MEKAPLGQHARKHRHEEAAVTAEAAESINTRDLAKICGNLGYRVLEAQQLVYLRSSQYLV